MNIFYFFFFWYFIAFVHFLDVAVDILLDHALLFPQICHIQRSLVSLPLAFNDLIFCTQTKQCLFGHIIFDLIFALCARSNVFWPFFYSYFGSSVYNETFENVSYFSCMLFSLSRSRSLATAYSFTSKYNNQHRIRINARYVCYCLSSFGCCCLSS